ncbi:hypothetical protein OsccyDRAFT_2216 [Leptolyngbyaceae cyanobacterium JSC-12]|nr:hypothetical protein OsccyDRAFT_2216 [Leptolyngbyaceae cyanobacterium JSC-12]
MQRTILMLAGTVVALVGFVPVSVAQNQSSSPSPAELLGVQERSIQKNSRPMPQVIPPESNQVSDSSDNQLLLYRIDRNTRVVVGPSRSTAQPGDFPNTAPDRDNRLQLLLDLDQ